MPDTLAASQVDVQGALSDMLRAILLFLPKAALFALILVVGFIVARVLQRVIDKVLERVGFDRLVERGGIRAALARSKYDASDIVAKLVYYAVVLFTLQLAFGVWGPNPVSDLISGVVAWLPKAFVAIIIVVVAAAIGSAVRDLVSGALGGLSYGRLLARLAGWFIIGLGVIAALNQIGVATTVTTPVLIAVLATVAGILIVGVGGGLVKPMQGRWATWLDKAAAESAAIAEHARAYQAGQREAAANREVFANAAPAPQRTTPEYAVGTAGTASAPEHVTATAPIPPAAAASPVAHPPTTAVQPVVPERQERPSAAAGQNGQNAQNGNGWPVVTEPPTQVIPPVQPEQRADK